MTGTRRNTLKQRFRHLLEKGHLIMHGRGRGLVCISVAGIFLPLLDKSAG
jgi:hypothetical protein